MENLVDSDQQAAVQKLRVSEPLTKPCHDDTVMLLYRCTNLQPVSQRCETVTPQEQKITDFACDGRDDNLLNVFFPSFHSHHVRTYSFH